MSIQDRVEIGELTAYAAVRIIDRAIEFAEKEGLDTDSARKTRDETYNAMTKKAASECRIQLAEKQR